jgi:hypothetical protein
MVERSAVMDGSSILPTYKGMCELRVVDSRERLQG